MKIYSPQLTIISAPNCLADPGVDGTNSEAFIILNLERMIVLIGDSKYSGEIKKAVFTVMNYLLPQKKVFPMHCSANMGAGGDRPYFLAFLEQEKLLYLLILKECLLVMMNMVGRRMASLILKEVVMPNVLILNMKVMLI